MKLKRRIIYRLSDGGLSWIGRSLRQDKAWYIPYTTRHCENLRAALLSASWKTNSAISYF